MVASKHDGNEYYPQRTLNGLLHKYMIALIGLDGKPVLGSAKLQKMLFVLAQKIPELAKESSFDADYYGPCGEMVDRECDYLKNMGVLYEAAGKIFLAKQAQGIRDSLAKEIGSESMAKMMHCKTFINDLTGNEVLAYVHLSYPNTAAQSVEYDRIKESREDLVLSLIKKEKISSQRGAELLHTTHTSIIDKMNKQGIRVLQ